MNLSDTGRLIYAPFFLLASFALYYARFWRAGDGKLFFCTSVFILPRVDDAVGDIFFNLALAISLCYVFFFLLLFWRATAKKKLRAAFAGAVGMTARLDAVAKAAFSAVFFVSCASLLPAGLILPLVLAFAYIAAAHLPAALYGVMLLAVLLAPCGRHPAGDCVFAFVLLSILLFFFNLYRSMKQAVGGDGEVIPFAPFLFISTAIVVMI